MENNLRQDRQKQLAPVTSLILRVLLRKWRIIVTVLKISQSS